MKKLFTKSIILLAVLLASMTALAQTNYRSIGPNEFPAGPWHVASSWEIFVGGNWVPAVRAPTNADGIITIRNSHPIAINVWQVIDQVVVEVGGNLELFSTIELVDGPGVDLQVEGGFYQNYTVFGEGTMLVNGNWSWNGNTMYAPTTISPSGQAGLFSHDVVLSTTVVNNGEFESYGRTMSFANGTFNNNGIYRNTSNNALRHASGVNAFNNAGLFTGGRMASDDNNVTVTIPFYNTGGIDVVGSFTSSTSNGSFTNTGSISFAPAGTLNILGSMAPGSSFGPLTEIAGTQFIINIKGNTNLNFALMVPPASRFNLQGSILSGTGSMAISGVMDWSGGTLDVPTTIGTGGTLGITLNTGKNLWADLTNNGTIDWINAGSNHFIFFNGSTLTNNGSIFLDETVATWAFQRSGGTNAFINTATGVFRKRGENVTFSTAGLPTTNSGIIKGLGTMNFGGGLTNNGIIAPGFSPGILTINPTSITATSSVQIEVLDGTGPGTGHDQLNISGTGLTALNGTLQIIDNIAAPLGIYTIMTTSGTFNIASQFTAVNKPANYGAPVVNTNTVTIEKISATLPVVWGGFTASEADELAVLKWITLQESNTSHFIVQHSKDGNNFDNIGEVKAKGNSSVASTYSFAHMAPSVGNNYYRLLQLDLDGKSTQSVTRTLAYNSQSKVFVFASPNPVNSVLRLSVQADDVTITLTDFKGSKLRTARLKQGIHHLNVDDLSAGIYQLTVYQKQRLISTQQLIKL